MENVSLLLVQLPHRDSKPVVVSVKLNKQTSQHTSGQGFCHKKVLCSLITIVDLEQISKITTKLNWLSGQ